CRGRIVFKQGRNSSTNGEYALKNSRTNLFKEGKDDVLWMSHIDIETPFIVHPRITLNMPSMPLVLVEIRRDKAKEVKVGFRTFM
ncbi:hypothetical protein MKX03_028582, partial [Papaver bracteatum]